jgi:hypothetical protein
MKFAALLLSLACLGVVSCERHKFEDVKVLHQSHGHDDHGHGDDHAEGEKKDHH